MKFGDTIITQLLLAVGALSRMLTRRGRLRLGKVIGWALATISAKRRAITLDNVRRALPETSPSLQKQVVASSYGNLGIVLAELLALPALSRKDLLDQVSMPGFDRVIERHKRGLPTILLSAHYGNWEYLAIVAGLLLEAPISIVVHPQSNEAANEILNSYRTMHGNVLLPMHNAARSLVKLLSGGSTAAFLVDQHGHPEKDPWISFLGTPAPTYEAPAALALKFNAPIFCTFAERVSDGRYVAAFEEIDMSDLEYTAEGIRELTTRHVRALEQAIQKHPELWSWQHRRWRGEPPVEEGNAS
jgi:KDO2-lipid IV(A) lauroyltransferase